MNKTPSLKDLKINITTTGRVINPITEEEICRAYYKWHLKQVAEILKMMCARDVGGINQEWALSDKEYQRLSKYSGGE